MAIMSDTQTPEATVPQPAEVGQTAAPSVPPAAEQTAAPAAAVAATQTIAPAVPPVGEDPPLEADLITITIKNRDYRLEVLMSAKGRSILGKIQQAASLLNGKSEAAQARLLATNPTVSSVLTAEWDVIELLHGMMPDEEDRAAFMERADGVTPKKDWLAPSDVFEALGKLRAGGDPK